MADNIQGNGINTVHEALARLAADPALLARALQRLGGDADEPPPPYYPPSNDSGTSTQPESPEPPAPRPATVPGEESEEERARLFKRRRRLRNIHHMSLPHKQFESQSWCLAKRLAILRFGEKEPQQQFPTPGTNELACLVREQLPKAEGIIRARWQDQGIWLGVWQDSPPHEARWPHEDDEPVLYGAAPRRPRPRRTRTTEAAAAAVASRPYSQFVYQVAKERDLLLGLVGDLDRPPLPRRPPWPMRARYPGDPPWRSPDVERAADAAYERQRLRSCAPPVPAPLKKAPTDVHSTAYENVKAAWVQCGIWDPRWTVLPGLRWMHEEPLERFIDRRLAEEDGVEWNEEEEADEDEEEDTEAPEPQLVATSRPSVDVPAVPQARPGEIEALQCHTPISLWSLPPHQPPQHDIAAAEADHEPQAGPHRAGPVPGDDADQERPSPPQSSHASLPLFLGFPVDIPAELDGPSPPGTPPGTPPPGTPPPRASKHRRDSGGSGTGPALSAKRARTATGEGSNDAPGDNGAHDASGGESSRLAGTGASRASQPP